MAGNEKLAALGKALCEPLPPGFTWYYPDPGCCAYGLGRELGLIEVGDLSASCLPDSLGISERQAAFIFNGAHIFTKRHSYAEVQPTDVARVIDRVLAEELV